MRRGACPSPATPRPLLPSALSGVTHVAVDLPGEDGAPELVVDGVGHALAADATLNVSLVGPSRVAGPLLRERGLHAESRLRIVDASYTVGAGVDATRAVRSRRDATVRVAARLLRDGVADAMVSAGPVAAATAAATFTLGPLAGATRPALAVVVGSPSEPRVLLDAGAASGVNISADQLTQCAVLGAAYATIRLRVARPRVGLLSAGPADPGRPAAGSVGDLIAELGFDFVGAVEAATVVAGGSVDVVLSDGFTGAVLVSVLRAVAQVVGQLPRTSSGWQPWEGAFVVGVDGIVVVVDGRPEGAAAGVTHAIAEAVAAHQAGWVPRQRAALAELVTHRRIRAGLPA